MALEKSPTAAEGWPPPHCTPLCKQPCPWKGKHKEILLVLSRCTNISGKEQEFAKCLDRYKRQGWLRKEPVADKPGHYPMTHWASMMGKHVALKMLFDFNCDLGVTVKNEESTQMETALFSTVRHLRQSSKPELSDGEVADIFGNVFDVFLSSAVDVIKWKQEYSLNSIFHFCCMQLKDNPMAKLYLQEMIKRIQMHQPSLSHREKVDLIGGKNKRGQNIIHELVDSSGCIEIFKFFSEKMESVFDEMSKVKNGSNKTPRQLAVEKKSLEVLRALGAPEVVLNSVVNAVGGPQTLRGTPNARRPPQGNTTPDGAGGNPPGASPGTQSSGGKEFGNSPVGGRSLAYDSVNPLGSNLIPGQNFVYVNAVSVSSVSTTGAVGSFQDIDGNLKKARKSSGGGNPTHRAHGVTMLPGNAMPSSAAFPNSFAEVSSSDQTGVGLAHEGTQKRPGGPSLGRGRGKRRRIEDLVFSDEDDDDDEDEDEDDINMQLDDSDSDDSSDANEDENEDTASVKPKGPQPGHTPFCPQDCNIQHHSLLLSLVMCTNHNSARTSNITAFLDKLNEYLGSSNQSWQEVVNDDIPDPAEEFQFPLVHWACVLGKYKLLETLASRPEVDFTIASKQTGETALHRTLLYLEEQGSLAEVRMSSKQKVKVFSEVLDVLTKRNPTILTIPNKEGDSPFHILAKAIFDCTVQSSRLSCFEGFFTVMLAKLKELEQLSTLRPGGLEQILTTTDQNEETFLHILACREGVGHLLIKKVLQSLDFSTVQSLKKKVNNKGKTASDIAKELGSLEMAQMLSPQSQQRSGEAEFKLQVKREPLAVGVATGNSIGIAFGDKSGTRPVELQVQVPNTLPQSSTAGLVTSSESPGPSLLPKRQENQGPPHASSSQSESEDPTDMEDDASSKQYDIVNGILTSDHPVCMKISVLDTLHRGLKESFSHCSIILQGVKTALGTATSAHEEMKKRKCVLLAQLEGVEQELLAADQEKSRCLRDVQVREEQFANAERQLRKCEDALMDLNNSERQGTHK